MPSLVRKFYGPPGTGKTTMLMSEVSREISSGAHPSEITYCSFTRAASYHSRDLAMAAFPQYTKQDFKNFATIHSICYHLLGLTPHSVFAHKQLQDFAKEFKYQLTEDSGKDMFSQSLIDMALGTDADHYENFINWQKNMMLFDFDEAYREYCSRQIELPIAFSREALKLYIERREEYKQRLGLWDFADMLLGVLEKRLTPLTSCKVFFLDESQDCSRLLFEVARLWSSVVERVYIAGDPYQAIFCFAGADPNLMIDFKADETITLKQSYRCSKSVHELSRKLVGRFTTRYPDDDFLPTDSEGSVYRTSIGQVNLDGDIPTFCLFRTRYLMENFEEHLLSRGIPFTTRRGKQGPLDKKERDVVLSLLNLYNDGYIPISDLHRVVKAIPQQPWLRRGAKADIEERAKENPSHMVSRASLAALGFTTEFIYELNTGNYIECLKVSAEEKSYFRKLLNRYGRPGLSEEPKLVVSTIHAVKGLEAERVIISLELTRLPYENLMRHGDEEHRVFYVGVTRARKEIGLLLPDTWKAYPL